MNTFYKQGILPVLIVIFIGCKSASHIEQASDKENIYFGYITNLTYDQLKQFLSSENIPVNDTVIIKYEYNGETCGSRYELPDDTIRAYNLKRQNYIQQKMIGRPNISVYRFREPGRDINKRVELDNFIIVDKKLFLFKTFFKKRYTCGSSIIIMPDRRFVMIRRDSHFDALEFTQGEIAEVLNR